MKVRWKVKKIKIYNLLLELSNILGGFYEQEK